MSTDSPEVREGVRDSPGQRSALERLAEDRLRRSGELRATRLTVIQLRIRHLSEARFRADRLSYPAPKAALAAYQHLDELIGEDVRGGVTRHRRLSWAVRLIPRLVAVIDGVVLFTFSAVIFNVPLEAPLAEPVRTLAAVLLAVLASGVAYTWLAVTGDRLKHYRGDLGQVRWRLVCATSWVMVGVSLVLVTALSLLMYNRILVEVIGVGDEAQAATARPLALAFAVLSAIANLSVVAVHAFDGSPESDVLRDLGRLLRRQQRAIHRQQREAMAVLGTDDPHVLLDGESPDRGPVGTS